MVRYHFQNKEWTHLCTANSHQTLLVPISVQWYRLLYHMCVISNPVHFIVFLVVVMCTLVSQVSCFVNFNKTCKAWTLYTISCGVCKNEWLEFVNLIFLLVNAILLRVQSFPGHHWLPKDNIICIVLSHVIYLMWKFSNENAIVCSSEKGIDEL